MKSLAVVVLLYLSIYSTSAAQEPLYPNAPIEASQFDFLIGKWDCNLYIIDDQGKTWPFSARMDVERRR